MVAAVHADANALAPGQQFTSKASLKLPAPKVISPQPIEDVEPFILRYTKAVKKDKITGWAITITCLVLSAALAGACAFLALKLLNSHAQLQREVDTCAAGNWRLTSCDAICVHQRLDVLLRSRASISRNSTCLRRKESTELNCTFDLSSVHECYEANSTTAADPFFCVVPDGARHAV